MRYWPTAACLLVVAVAAAPRQEPGTSALGIALRERELRIDLRGPAGNFTGFERQPATPEQTARLAAALDVLRAGAALFLTPPAADCRLVSASVSPPDYATDRPAELAASWTFRCSSPAALAWVDAQLFARFPGTAKLATSVVTPLGKKAVVLTPGTPRVLLPRAAPVRN